MSFGLVVVDDASDLRFLLTRAIERDGRFRVLASVGDGQAGLEAVATHAPDVVLMDVSMPIMDGLTATRELKRRHPDLPVVILTGYADRSLELSAEEAGASAFISKDQPVTHVLSVLAAQVGER